MTNKPNCNFLFLKLTNVCDVLFSLFRTNYSGIYAMEIILAISRRLKIISLGYCVRLWNDCMNFFDSCSTLFSLRAYMQSNHWFASLSQWNKDRWANLPCVIKHTGHSTTMHSVIPRRKCCAHLLETLRYTSIRCLLCIRLHSHIRKTNKHVYSIYWSLKNKLWRQR